MALDPAQASAGLLTTAQILDSGFTYDEMPPEPATCKYCGAKLLYRGVVSNGRVLRWFTMPERCTCTAAGEYWRRHDAKEAENAEQQREREDKQRRFDRAMRIVGQYHMKRKFTVRTFATWDPRPEAEAAFQIAADYACNFKKYAKTGTGLYFEGPNGTGKTHLAAAIANQLIAEGIPVICKTSIGLLDDIKAAFDRNEAEILRLLKSIDLLIIDDLGKEQCTEWSQTMLYSILNDRYEDMRPTCITTNYGEEVLLQLLSLPDGDNGRIKAILSRLHETNIAVPMVCADYRSRA